MAMHPDKFDPEPKESLRVQSSTLLVGRLQPLFVGIAP